MESASARLLIYSRPDGYDFAVCHSDIYDQSIQVIQWQYDEKYSYYTHIYSSAPLIQFFQLVASRREDAIMFDNHQPGQE